MSDDNTTPLQYWLNLHGLKYNHLATQLDMSPHTIKKFASGDMATINKTILQKLALHTGLNYQELIDPASQAISPTATGDGRIDVALSMIARYLHADDMAKKCRKYFSLDFHCVGKVHSERKIKPLNYDEMCALNSIRAAQINSSLLSVAWYDADCDTLEARILHTYWRASVVDGDGVSYNDTFIVLGLEKSISEMTPFDLPQIKSWWWDSPTAIRAADQSTEGIDSGSANIWPVRMCVGGVNT